MLFLVTTAFRGIILIQVIHVKSCKINCIESDLYIYIQICVAFTS